MLNFELSVQEANTVIAALAAQPYGQVASLISKMQQQATKQIQDNPELANDADAETEE